MKPGKYPQQIGRYITLGSLGRGGMGIVYRALAPETGKVIALKLLYPAEPMVEVLGMKQLNKLFTAEAKKMAKLSHPNIVAVLDLDSDNGTPFFTMEYLCNNIGMMIGEKFILEQSTRLISPDRVLDYGSQILEALRFLHDAGIIHRDIKPQNILVTDDDTIKICDFGMSRELEEKSFAAQGMKIGSPYYIAPEQNRNPESADHRSDLYSVAVLLYRMLTGELPGMKSFLLSSINPLYDRAWDDFFIKALEWNPASRFQNANEMASSLLCLELDWDNRKAHACRMMEQEKQVEQKNNLPMRSVPVRVSGVKAQEIFTVNELWQPVSYTENIFTEHTETTLLDKSTGLTWQRSEVDVPVERDKGDAVISALNKRGFGGISSWRLPTVNELLTLVDDQRLPASDCKTDLQSNRCWYWSCDLRSEKTSWYVNTRMGYTGWQENGCRYAVRAVASPPAR